MVPLLERADDLGVLRAKARLAVAGSPQIVVVEGPAGIGKTSLLDEFTRVDADGRFLALRAHCDELEQEVPLGVARQLFGPLLAGAAPDERERLLSGAARSAADVLGETGPVDASCAALRGLHGVALNAAARTPVLLAVDDAHFADGSSLRWLLYLARSLVAAPVLVVLTRRSASRRASLTDVVLRSNCTVVRPRPLTRVGVAALLGEPPAAESTRSCHEFAGGNPLLTKALGRSRDGVRVFTDVLLTWIAGASTDAREFAAALAVLGDAVDVRLPARLAGLDPPRGAAAWDELRRIGAVRADPVPHWTHPLVRESVLVDLPPPRRAELHAAAARLLDESGAAADRVCAHLLESAPRGDPWVVRKLCAHATRVRGSGAPELAADLLRRALAEPPSERDRAGVLVGLGMAESYARPDVGIRHLTEAMSRIDDPATLAGTGRWTADSLVREGRTVEAVDLLARLSGDLAARDHEAGALLDAHRIVVAAVMAPHLATTAADVSGLAGNTVAERAALGAAASTAALFGGTAERTADLALRALPATSSEMADPSVVGTIEALSWTDRLDVVTQRCDVAMAEAGRVKAWCTLAKLLNGRAAIAWLAGDLPAAADLARRAVDTLREEWWGALGAVRHGTVLRIMVDSGDTAGARRLVARLDALAGDDFPSLFLAGMCAGVRIASGDVRGGLAAVLDCGHRLVRAGYENPIPVPWRVWAARAHVRLGEFDAARRLANEALDHATHWGTPRAIGGALHVLGVATGGTEGLGLIRGGVEALESSPARLDLTRALIDLGTAQHEQGQHREAHRTLRRALGLAERCGALGVVTTIRQCLAHTGAHPGHRPVTGLDALTESERRVAELAARWSNRRIAEELHLTLRTVETHLSATYRKLGIAGRPELHEAFHGDSSRSA